MIFLLDTVFLTPFLKLILKPKDIDKLHQKAAKLVDKVIATLATVPVQEVERQLNKQGHSYRGLESLYIEEKDNHTHEAKATISRIIEEQKRMRRIGEQDMEKELATLYHEITQSFSETARSYAKADEIAWRS